MAKLIKSLLTNIIPQEHAWKITLFEQWSKTIGPIGAYVSIEKVEGNVLYIGVSHPTWAQEIQSLTPLILEKLNADLPGNPITSIRLRPMARPKKVLERRLRATPAPLAPVSLSGPEKQLLASAGDEQLQSTLAAYLLHCKAKRQGSKPL